MSILNNWKSIMTLCVFIVFVIWLFKGGKKHDFIGIQINTEKKTFKQRSRKEYICKKCLEHWFRVPFTTERPDFLKNPITGNNLELDCYNKDIKLAIEFNGIQHYKYPNRFHKTIEEFEDQVKKDKFKIEQCNKHNVHLIVVPYNIKEEKIMKYIKEKLPANLIQYANEEIKIDF